MDIKSGFKAMQILPVNEKGISFPCPHQSFSRLGNSRKGWEKQ